MPIITIIRHAHTSNTHTHTESEQHQMAKEHVRDSEFCEAFSLAACNAHLIGHTMRLQVCARMFTALQLAIFAVSIGHSSQDLGARSITNVPKPRTTCAQIALMPKPHQNASAYTRHNTQLLMHFSPYRNFPSTPGALGVRSPNGIRDGVRLFRSSPKPRQLMGFNEVSV